MQGDDGANLVEWAMLALLIAMVALIAVKAAGLEVAGMYDTVASSWPS